MNILVTGGAGYIGSHAVARLLALKHKVFIVDDFSNGDKRNVNPKATLLKVKLSEVSKLSKSLTDNKIEAVFHIAALKAVGESVKHPLSYYENNIGQSLDLLKAMEIAKVKYMIFSSSAAVYGQPEVSKVKEDAPMRPMNPYGKTKKMFEVILKDVAAATDLKYVALRYFNVAGYDKSGKIGVREPQAMNLIPVVINSILDKKELQIYGNDYPTKDGTPIRDYIHVSDLVEAHVKALDYLIKTKQNQALNLGNNQGYSVKDILKTTEKVLKLKLNVKYVERRIGDPAMLIADASKANKLLKWKPSYKLEAMIKSTYDVYKKDK